jgi:nodulation protein F
LAISGAASYAPEQCRRAKKGLRHGHRFGPGKEKTMDEVADKIVAILKKNMKNPPETISLDTKLTDLEIESLDLAVIVFDIEDSFGIQIPYNANEDMTDFATVGSVVERVKSIISQNAGAAA